MFVLNGEKPFTAVFVSKYNLEVRENGDEDSIFK